MYVIGVTGGIGSGKSAVLTYLERHYGAFVTRLDDVARALVEPGGLCYENAIRMLGREYVLPDGTLDRSRIAGDIFSDEDRKRKWNGMLLPEVRRLTLERISEKKDAGIPLFVIESAILLEEKYDAFCNELWYIYADKDTRYSRLTSSRGYDTDRILRTMAQQLPEERFRVRCDLTIDNSGRFSETEKAIDRRMAILKITAKSGAEDNI